MKPQLRWLALAGVAGLLAAEPATLRAQISPGPGTAYRLTFDSTFSTSEVKEAPMRGRFTMIPQISPLDWNVYELELVRLELRAPGQPVRVFEGRGRYTLGGRGPITEQLTLSLREDADAYEFDSGQVPATGIWPALDLVLTALNAPGRLELRLAAVPMSTDWHYRLIGASQFLDDCAVCDRLSIPVPVRGSFDLAFIESNPLLSRYDLLNLHFTDASPEPTYEIVGEGTVTVGGEVAVVQRWRLDLQVTTPSGNRRVTLTNELTGVERKWPMLKTRLVEDGGTDFSRFYLDLEAAPFRELWFNTLNGLTPGMSHPPKPRLSGADILTDTGRLVRSGTDLLAAVGLAGDAEASIDAFEVLLGGEIVFSLTAPAKSSTLGELQEGDALSERGQVAKKNQGFMVGFGLMPPLPDLGLDAVAYSSGGEWLCSIRQPAFSERLGETLGRGDILGSGRILRQNRELLAQFNPPDRDHDYGLDGFYLWRSGEIWFSTEEGFQDAKLGAITDGDILSTDGYVVARNLDLVHPFQPLEDLANFGLQGLFVISDAAIPPDEAGPTMTVLLSRDRTPTLGWKSLGRVFQVEKSQRVRAPFVTASPLQTESVWADPDPALASPERYYRVRAW